MPGSLHVSHVFILVFSLLGLMELYVRLFYTDTQTMPLGFAHVHVANNLEAPCPTRLYLSFDLLEVLESVILLVNTQFIQPLMLNFQRKHTY